MSAPLEGVRVVEYAQYVAGPLCGVLLGDLGAEVIKVEPPAGDAYRFVMPVAPAVGRYFLPLNRGKRSVVLDLKTVAGREASGRLLATADVVLHNYPTVRARAFGLDWDTLHELVPGAVLGVVSSFGAAGPLAGAPAYDLIAQAHAGLLTAHASPGDRVPVRAGGIPMADLTAGFLLATGVLAALYVPGSQESASGWTCRSSRRRWRCSSRISSGSKARRPRPRHASPIARSSTRAPPRSRAAWR